jgi:hypothetical protein
VIDSFVFVVRTCRHVVHEHESVSDSCSAAFGHREAHGTDVAWFIVECELTWEDMYSIHSISNRTLLTTHSGVSE